MVKLLHILEDIDLDSISASKSFKDLPPNLKLISQRGKTRNVYEYNDKYVLKIAKNKKGLEQNKNEVEVLNKYDSPLFPKLEKYDNKNYRYIVIEKVNDFKNYSSFYKFTYPNIDIIYNKLLDFYDKNKNKYSIPDYVFFNKKDTYSHTILNKYYDKKDIVFMTKEENKKIWDKYIKKGIYSVDTDEIENQVSPDQRITFMTYKEMDDLLGNNSNVKELKKLIDQGYKLNDTHWKNFGYKNNQLKILDLGI